MTKSLKAPSILGAAAVIGAIVALVAGPITGVPTAVHANSPAATSQPTSTPTPIPSVEGCEAEFVQVALNNAGNKVDADFEKDYLAATAAEATNLPEAARGLLLEKAGHNAQFLAIRAQEFGLYENPNDWKPLVKDGCLSQEGQKLHAQYEGVLKAKGTTIVEANAPTNGINSGIHDGTFGLADSAGIYGDLRSVKITLKDGTSVYILIRCANGVHPTNPGLPEVPTDNPPVCPWDPSLPPGDPNCLQPKNPSQDPGPRGNAPDGGGVNKDKSPGTYIPPGDMERPPDTPYSPPPAPKPEPPTGGNDSGGSKPKPTEDPAPPPPPEVEAPKPDNPETGCIVIPGIEDCKG